jgi:hypothetical protein
MDLKKIISLALAAIIVIAVITTVPKLVHNCDDCGKFFIGTGYEPNVVEDFFATEDQIICKDCAEKQHKLSLAVGKDLDDFKISLF